MVAAKLAGIGAFARYAGETGVAFALSAFMRQAVADFHKMLQASCIVWEQFKKLFESQMLHIYLRYKIDITLSTYLGQGDNHHIFSCGRYDRMMHIEAVDAQGHAASGVSCQDKYLDRIKFHIAPK